MRFSWHFGVRGQGLPVSGSEGRPQREEPELRRLRPEDEDIRGPGETVGAWARVQEAGDPGEVLPVFAGEGIQGPLG